MADDLSPDEQEIAQRIQRLADTPISGARPPADVASLAMASPPVKRWRAPTLVAVLGVAVVLGLAIRAQTSGPTTLPSDSPEPTSIPTGRTTPASAGLFEGDGWTFEYPTNWKLYPMRIVTFEFTTIGYVASTPVDTKAICSESENSTSCDFGAYPLPPGNVVIELANWAPGIADPVGFFEHPKAGSPVTVGGMPAVLLEDEVAQDRVRLEWKIARPDAFGVWVQVSADIRGPRLKELRDEVEASMRTFTFSPPPVALSTGDGRDEAVAAQAIAALKVQDPQAYSCLPDAVGVSQTTTVSTIPAGDLKRPLEVTCSVAISPTNVGFWKMQIVIAWDGGAEKVVQWLFADGTLSARSVQGAPPGDYCCK